MSDTDYDGWDDDNECWNCGGEGRVNDCMASLDDSLLDFPVERVRDNRLLGLLREISEAIKEEHDPMVLRKLGQSLKLIGDFARSKAFRETKQNW